MSSKTTRKTQNGVLLAVAGLTFAVLGVIGIAAQTDGANGTDREPNFHSLQGRGDVKFLPSPLQDRGPFGVQNTTATHGDDPNNPRDPDRFAPVSSGQTETRNRFVPSGLTADNDGFLAPRFEPNQRAWVLSGFLTLVQPAVRASIPQDADLR